jgi:flagellar basal-body rod protein FlgB
VNTAGFIMASALRVRSLRESALAENLANSDVPGYLPRDIDFRRALDLTIRDLPDASQENQIAGQGRVVLENLRADSSGVDVSSELGEVFQNSLAYVATMKLFGDMMTRLKTAFS